MGTIVATRSGVGQGDPTVHVVRDNDPTAPANAGIVYWKELSPGVREMFAADTDGGGQVIQITDGTGLAVPASTFDNLTDSPANKTGDSLKHVRVNAGETDLEYVDHDRAAHDALGTGDLVYTTETQTLTAKTLRGPDGSDAAPTYAFSSSTNTGMSLSASQIRFGVGGTHQMRISSGAITHNVGLSARTIGFGNSSDVIRLRGEGTASAPALQFSNDFGTGVYLHAIDHLGFATDQTNRMLIDDEGNVGIGTLVPTSKLHVQGDTRITGDLLVDGQKLWVEGESVMLADNHLLLNKGYTNDAAQTGGLVVNFDPTTTVDTIAVGGFTAGVDAASNPTVVTDGSAIFAATDIVEISGSGTNDGIFEVKSHVGTLLTVEGIGLTGTNEDFLQNQFETAAGAGAITKIAVSVSRAGTDGFWEHAFGSSTGFTFDDVGLLAATQTLTNKTYNLTDNTLTGTAAQFNTALSDDTFTYVSDNLSVFSATTSAQLAGVISDETGSGALVFADGPVVTSLRIAGTTSTSFLELDNGVATAAAAAGEARIFYSDTDKTILESHDTGGNNTMARIKTGTYTGDGTTSQAITGVGFKPIFLKIWNRVTVDETGIVVFETTPEIMDDTANGGVAYHSVSGTSHRFLDNAIILLDADGFTVGDDGVDGPPNSSGLVYNYMAIG